MCLFNMLFDNNLLQHDKMIIARITTTTILATATIFACVHFASGASSVPTLVMILAGIVHITYLPLGLGIFVGWCMVLGTLAGILHWMCMLSTELARRVVMHTLSSSSYNRLFSSRKYYLEEKDQRRRRRVSRLSTIEWDRMCLQID
jgi:hypothetical protein